MIKKNSVMAIYSSYFEGGQLL